MCQIGAEQALDTNPTGTWSVADSMNEIFVEVRADDADGSPLATSRNGTLTVE